MRYRRRRSQEREEPALRGAWRPQPAHRREQRQRRILLWRQALRRGQRQHQSRLSLQARRTGPLVPHSPQLQPVRQTGWQQQGRRGRRGRRRGWLQERRSQQWQQGHRSRQSLQSAGIWPPSGRVERPTWLTCQPAVTGPISCHLCKRCCLSSMLGAPTKHRSGPQACHIWEGTHRHRRGGSKRSRGSRRGAKRVGRSRRSRRCKGVGGRAVLQRKGKHTGETLDHLKLHTPQRRLAGGRGSTRGSGAGSQRSLGHCRPGRWPWERSQAPPEGR